MTAIGVPPSRVEYLPPLSEMKPSVLTRRGAVAFLSPSPRVFTSTRLAPDSLPGGTALGSLPTAPTRPPKLRSPFRGAVTPTPSSTSGYLLPRFTLSLRLLSRQNPALLGCAVNVWHLPTQPLNVTWLETEWKWVTFIPSGATFRSMRCNLLRVPGAVSVLVNHPEGVNEAHR